MKRLFIAEKPSLGKDIVAALGTVTEKGNGYIRVGDDTVTWCFGHMLEQAEPDEYTAEDAPRSPKTGRKLWRVEDLPIIPVNWILNPKEDSAAQLAIIGRLLKDADVVVHAGDPDREGQLLVDNVLDHFNNRLPVKRFWVQSNDAVTYKRGLAALTDNADYKGYGKAALARGRADWIIGMNLSRAFTLRAQRAGSQILLSVGRVQTPTLALVVERDKQIEDFKPVPYHKLKAAFQHENGTFIASWEAREDQAGLDPEGRLIDTKIADELANLLAGKAGEIDEYEQTPKTDSHPRAFSLSDITLVSSRKFGYGAEEVLNICQSLYEKKFTSYPRTDCAYLPEAQHVDAPLVLAALKIANPELSDLIDQADPKIKSKTWDDSKVTAHYGLIPTMHEGSASTLPEKERNVYNLIVRAYLAQFYPLHKFLSTAVRIDVEGEKFHVTGKTVTANGWRDVYANDDAEEDDEKEEEAAEGKQVLPAMKLGDNAKCLKVARKDTKTKAPSRFTEATLQRAMERIDKYVTDPAHKKMLREEDGIGTSATRPSIIAELLKKGFLEPFQKNKIISTKVGRSFITVLPEVVKSPVLTAIYERILRDIEAGKAEVEQFMEKQEAFVTDQVAKANTGSVKIAGAAAARQVSTVHKCEACNHGLIRNATGKRGPWWGCSNYPTCEQTYPDVKGRPNYTKAKQ